MRLSFLNSLVGKSIDAATLMIKDAGLTLELVPEECNAVTLQARRHTVIVFQRNGRVSEVMPGDGGELEKDVNVRSVMG